MSLETLCERLPEYAKDLRLNLSALPRTPGLTPEQLWGSALAAALASREGQVIRVIDGEAAIHLDEATLRAARAAAAVMAMNNVYYRSVHLLSDATYAQMPARLRMQVIANPGIEKRDFELFCLAASAVNGCGACLDAHEKELRGAGVSAETLQSALRIAAIVHGVAATLDAEALRDGQGSAAAA